MRGSQGHGEAVLARVRMVAQPASVPAARRFVDDALNNWGRQGMVEDVGLCVTELSTNATLHSGSQFFEVELQNDADKVRVAVVDAGETPAESLATQIDFTDALLDEITPDLASTTGRGMFIVSALATAWGIEELPEGTRVWAEFADGDETYDARAPEVTHQGTATSPEMFDPRDWVAVQLRDCPVSLLGAHDDNLADATRELQLIGTSLQKPSFEELAGLLAGHVARHAVNWDAARIQAREALRNGRKFADIDVLAPRNVMDEIRFLRNLIWEIEALSEAGELLTLPAPPPVQRLRDWLESEFRRQVVDGLDPVSYLTWLPARLDPAADSARV